MSKDLTDYTEKKLEVQISSLPNSGKGLFASEDIKKGELITEYTGTIRTWKECEKLAQEDKCNYVFFVNTKICIDAYEHMDVLARYANDANGLSKIQGLNNNAEFFTISNRGFLKATKFIPSGAEIFVRYGPEYWQAIRHNIRLEEQKKLKAQKELKRKEKSEKKLMIAELA